MLLLSQKVWQKRQAAKDEEGDDAATMMKKKREQPVWKQKHKLKVDVDVAVVVQAGRVQVVDLVQVEPVVVSVVVRQVAPVAAAVDQAAEGDNVQMC